MLSFFLCSAQGFLHADGTRIVNEKGENVLLRGIGLGGWMLQEGYMLRIYSQAQQNKIRSRIQDIIGTEKTDAFYKAWLQNHTTRADVDALKSWGFNSIRLPMHYNLYTLPIQEEKIAGKNTWLQKGFDLTDSLLAWCKANDMYLILDLHATPGGQGNDLNIADGDKKFPNLWQSRANQEKMIALWRKLAERYANEPYVAAYDIINEPNWGFENNESDPNGLKEKGNAPLKKLMQEVTAAIREVDKKHIIVIEGNGWGNNYSNILPTWDENMVLSFHKYWNYNDEASIAHILNIRDTYKVPVWLGETGENSNTWFTQAIALFEKHNIGWAWWPLKKLGFNNPLQIKSNTAYDSLVSYLNGRNKTVPPAEEVYKGLMQLASDAKFDNNIYHQDVTDAMMRQPFTNATLPFHKNLVNQGTVMAAVDYDLGKNGFAYLDMDTANYRISTGKASVGNQGQVYRNDGVDIFQDKDDLFFVGQTEAGEWLQYSVDVSAAGSYQLVFSGRGSGSFTVFVDGKPAGPAISFSSSSLWSDKKATPVQLTIGLHRIRIHFIKAGVELKSFRFVQQ